MAEFFSTRLIKFNASIDGNTYGPFEGSINGQAQLLLEQVAEHVTFEGNLSPSIQINLEEPKSFASLKESDLKKLARCNDSGLIFLAVQLGLTDYLTLEKFGFKILVE